MAQSLSALLFQMTWARFIGHVQQVTTTESPGYSRFYLIVLFGRFPENSQEKGEVLTGDIHFRLRAWFIVIIF